MLYQAKCINWSGKTPTKKYYSELFAEELLLHLSDFSKIRVVSRSGTYCRENHCQIEFDLCKSNRDEENFAKRITGLNLPKIGRILDYQVPLKSTKADKGVGKIDLISFNEQSKTFHLIELKYIGNKETLLRAVLESYTYFKKVDQSKLITDYVRDYNFRHGKAINDLNINAYTIVPTVLVSEDCNPYKELGELDFGDRPELKKLSVALGVNLYRVSVDIF